jgi:hypothetical protein
MATVADGHNIEIGRSSHQRSTATHKAQVYQSKLLVLTADYDRYEGLYVERT